MTPHNQISQLAREIATRLQNQKAAVEAEFQVTQLKLAEIQAKLDAAKVAHNRLANFKVERGADYNCPRCHIMDGADGILSAKNHPVGATDITANLFRCNKCPLELSC
jgi:hypothetical protein